MRQQLIFLEHWYKPGMCPKARPVPLDKRPDRVWTLFCDNDKNSPPSLPFRPQHHHNAFLEDEVHDWNFYPPGRMSKSLRSKSAPSYQIDDGLGTFDYASRVADRPVWILLEYKD